MFVELFPEQWVYSARIGIGIQVLWQQEKDMYIKGRIGYNLGGGCNTFMQHDYQSHCQIAELPKYRK